MPHSPPTLVVVAPGVDCQLSSFPSVLPTGAPSLEEPWSPYLRRRLRGLWCHAQRALQARGDARPRLPQASLKGSQIESALEAGDRVRVRSAAAIRETLDGHGRLAGCGFGRGMYQFCEREFRVARRIELFYDEARGRMLKARHLVALDGVHCDGSSSRETGGCDRMCFYFWRTEWLEKIAAPFPSRLVP